MAVAALLAGAALGEAFAVLHDTVKNVGSKVLMFKFELKNLKSNLDLLEPVVKEISQLNRELGRLEEEPKSLIEDMKKAEELIRKCSAIPWWKVMFQASHSKQLTELNKSIVNFCQVHMAAQMKRDTMQILGNMSKISGNTSQISQSLEDASQISQMVWEEFKAFREENKLKKEKAQILITPSGQCGNTTSLEIHGQDVLIKGFASMSLMTSLSTPSSSVFSYRRYNVFLSFIGEGTRMNFVDDLYVDLERNGLFTFKDDNKLVKEPSIGSDCIRGIEESTVAIVLISKSYVSNHWCLSKLQKIVSCARETRMTIFPIFYDLDPYDLEEGRAPFPEAFTKHENYFTENKEWVETWRAALTYMVDYSWRFCFPLDENRARDSNDWLKLNITYNAVEKMSRTKSYTF